MPTETTAGESSSAEAAPEGPPAEEVSETDYWMGLGSVTARSTRRGGDFELQVECGSE
ncbi:MAG TPA: hypothetical protein VF129_01465 [Actinomycetota bacterium]